MSLPLHTPKTREQYADPIEQQLYRYFTSTLGWGEWISARMVFEFLIEARAFTKGKTILDAGAGNKRFEPFFRDANYITLEHPSGIEMKKMQGIGYDIVAELDADAFAAEESFDAIYCHSVLEHIARPEKFFANAMTVLKPGGRLYICVPFMYVEHEAPYDFNRFTRYGLRSRLEEAGFKITKLIPSSNAAYGALVFAQRAVQQDALARGFEVKNITLKSGHSVELLPLLGEIVGALNGVFDDAIYDNDGPNGFLCVAEKPATK